MAHDDGRLLVIDGRYRVALGKRMVEAGAMYRASIDDEGIITLLPVVAVDLTALDPETRSRIENASDRLTARA